MRSLISRLRASNQLAIPFPPTYRGDVWQLIATLAEDPQPDQVFEARYGGSNMTPYTLSINSIRPKALHCAVRFGSWLRKATSGIGVRDSQTEAKASDLTDMRTVLERLLDTSVEPSLAVRSVYGWSMSVLMSIEPDWAKELVDRIFPPDARQNDFWEAAWDAFVLFNPPSRPAWELLKSQYLRAIRRMAMSPTAADRATDDPNKRLAEHLMTLYWWVFVEFGDEERPLEKFFETAAAELKDHALGFIGRSLNRTDDDIPSDSLGRLQRLFEYRLQNASSALTQTDVATELAPFSWWFVSGKLPSDWSTRQLREVLRLTGRIDRDRRVVEQLAQLAERQPEDAIRCLDLLVEGDPDGWHIAASRRQASQLLATCLVRNSLRANQDARALINKLGARGHLEFRQLLAGDARH